MEMWKIITAKINSNKQSTNNSEQLEEKPLTRVFRFSLVRLSLKLVGLSSSVEMNRSNVSAI